MAFVGKWRELGSRYPIRRIQPDPLLIRRDLN
jgi:hypothetical protein